MGRVGRSVDRVTGVVGRVGRSVDRVTGVVGRVGRSVDRVVRSGTFPMPAHQAGASVEKSPVS